MEERKGGHFWEAIVSEEFSEWDSDWWGHA